MSFNSSGTSQLSELKFEGFDDSAIQYYHAAYQLLYKEELEFENELLEAKNQILNNEFESYEDVFGEAQPGL